MILIFTVLNTIIFLWTSLGILMFSNNLKQISKSVDLYLDPKAYKPENEVRLITLLVDKYSHYENQDLVDLHSLILDGFYNHKIGKFKATSIETLANKGKGLLWISIISMVVVEGLTVGLGRSNLNSILIIISAGLGIILAFYEIHSDIEMGKNQLFLKIKNHLSNEYPQFKINQKEKEEVSFLLRKIEDLEGKIRKRDKVDLQVKEEKEEKKPIEEELQEEDIIQILKCFDMFT